ncbi:hypothetical protein [Scytonema sp. NUACC26]
MLLAFTIAIAIISLCPLLVLFFMARVWAKTEKRKFQELGE